MRNYVTLKIDSDYLLDLLVERLGYWNLCDTEAELYELMYQRAIEDGAFDNIELDIKAIVDNDITSNFQVVYREDIGGELFNELLSEYEETGGELSEGLLNEIRKIDSFKYIQSEYIEAMNDKAFLLRVN